MGPMTFAVLGSLITGLTVQAAESTLASAGAWDLTSSDGASANGKTCVLMPKISSRIQIGHGTLNVTGLPKNSIFNYQYRIDDGSPSMPAIPTPDMQNTGTIVIDGDAFTGILNGRRFRIRILDKWHEAITEDVDLSGLRNLYDKMGETCK